MHQWRRSEISSLTFDELSMERSKGFVKALQELKNLRPQLYSAAEYCENSYLHNEQKQLVLNNLKEYVVQALVNAVDHIGTVAYKLTDLFEQQILDVSNVELKISCLNQQILTCQLYADKEGLRQQQILVGTPKHHKHYILPNSLSHKAERNQLSHAKAKPRPYPPGTPATNTLSFLLALETNESSNTTTGAVDAQSSKLTNESFKLLGNPKTDVSSSPASTTHLQSSSGNSTLKSFSVKDPLELPKPLPAFRSFDNPRSRALIRAPQRNKSMISMLLAKSKSSKTKKVASIH